MATEKELLDVLDMSEDEQETWIGQYAFAHKKESQALLDFETSDKEYNNSYGDIGLPMSLADLAFRLRDEAGEVALMKGQKQVYIAVHYKEEFWKNYSETTSYAETERWFGSKEARPIRWIIAALIAKDKEDE